MRKVGFLVLLAVFSASTVFAVFSCAPEKQEEKVVFIDLETVISEEKKRIFSRVLRGELSREEAEERVGRFFIRFGEVLVDYEEQGYIVLDSKSVLGGGRDITGEILKDISARGEEDE